MITRNNRSHYKIIDGILIEKKGYDTEKEALHIARFLNTKPDVINKMVVYKCSKCNKYHIGNNGHFLTDEDKIKYKQKLIKEKYNLI